MLPIAGSLYGRQISDIIIDNLGLPPNRRAAQKSSWFKGFLIKEDYYVSGHY